MTEDFNIRDSIWDLLFSYYSSHSNILINIANSLNLYISKPTNQIPTRYSDNQNDLNSIIDLAFLWLTSSEFDNHTIHPEWRLILDHTPLIVNIAIFEEYIQTKTHTSIKNSKKEKNFLVKLINSVKSLNMDHISSKKSLEQVVQEFIHNTEEIWFKHSKVINITKHLKSWWNEGCQRELEKYRTLRSLEDWKFFRSIIKKTK